MDVYKCELCDFASKLQSNYLRHLTTNKHIKNEDEFGDITLNEEKKGQKKDKKGHFIIKKGQKKDKKRIKIEKGTDNKCEYCNKEFSSRQTLLRHKKKYCKIKESLQKKLDLQNDIIKKMDSEMKEYRKDKDKLYDQLGELIKKTGNTTINKNTTNNTINLNSYGNEDLSHITNSFKTQMLKGPFEMIPKMIEEVHFNDKKPENKNICYPNKKNNNVKIFKEGKWKYYNKEDLMDEIMGNNYCILDVYYDEKKDDILSDIQKKRYLNFKDIYNSGKLDKDTKDEINLILLNGEKI